MVKNYKHTFLFILVSASTFMTPIISEAQEIKLFALKDFDLVGNVKSCIVITDYGKEEYDFDKVGRLTKSVTRYNDLDYDITYYKYEGRELLEKRVENYRDGDFDKNTSIANFYTIDTVPNRKITEKIVLYTKELLEQYEYSYDAENKLVNIKRINNSGIDGTRVEYAEYKGESTTTYFLDEVIQKSTRISTRKDKKGGIQKLQLTKEFLEGKPSIALERIFDSNGALVSENKFVYDELTKEFVSQLITIFSYNDLGMLTEKKTNNKEIAKKYIYQFDNGNTGNWVKQIITPDNSYTTRKIKYYKIEEESKE